ncbi:hypothetical protein Mapa_008156 [Marchantia paleacea]|nr:hypothetical protein Mapa_008156 [Marchantia paleacea]
MLFSFLLHCSSVERSFLVEPENLKLKAAPLQNPDQPEDDADRFQTLCMASNSYAPNVVSLCAGTVSSPIGFQDCERS